MSRFYEGDEEGLPWELWNQATMRALSSARGQRTLAALEQALLALPQPRLISNRLAENGQVCAIGAFVLAQRVEAGEERAAVLADLERAIDDDGYMGADTTACIGKSAGMAYTLAWRIAELNDEDFRTATPEQRYDGILTWIRQAQATAASSVAGTDTA